jgi:hypothetical protein
MKISSFGKRQGERGSTIIVYCVVAVAVIVALAGVASLVARTATITERRSNVISAQQYAQAGVVAACSDLNNVLTNNASGSLASKLASAANPYTRNTTLSTAATNVYQRTIAAPFTGQSVVAQVWMAAVSAPTAARIVGSATVGGITQTATANTKMAWGYPGAIISVNAGTTETGISKSVAQDGNVVINGSKSGPIVVDGGTGFAVLANGRVDYDTNYANPAANAYSMTNWNTANQVPDYTSQGSSNALFDIGRFIAVADLTTNGYSTNTHNNHFTNLISFINATKTHTNSASAMQGVVVVDVNSSDPDQKNLTSGNIPNGINIKGTWLMNFTGTGWDPTSEKIIVTAAININAADLSGLVVNNPATYPSGYPPVYTDPTKNPVNIDITSKGYQNFQPGDDLPAEIYTIGVLDMHGNANISGVLYTPSYMEIENKGSGQTQYIKGSLIMGNGLYYENTQTATSIISFDPTTLDGLTTLGGVGKRVNVTYWQ